MAEIILLLPDMVDSLFLVFFEYYNTSSQHSKVSTDGGMVVPGEWFVEN